MCVCVYVNVREYVKRTIPIGYMYLGLEPLCMSGAGGGAT